MPVTRNQSNAAAQAKTSSDDKDAGTSKDPPNDGGDSAESEPPRRDSPENCSICLGPFNNKSFTSSCAHSFCFVCLKQWSKVKAECPLCKQPFTSIFHSIRSNQDYDIYELPRNQPRQLDPNIFNYVNGITTYAPHYFSLSQPGFDADLTLSNFSRFQFRHRRSDRYFNVLYPRHPHGEHQYSYPSTHHSNPYAYTGPSVNPATHVSAATWPRDAENFRREVYRRHLGPPAVILGTENSSYRLTPAMVAASAHRIQRILPWLTRELRVLLHDHFRHVRFAISVIQPLLSQVLIDSDYFYERVAPLIGRRAGQFIREFVAFANSALSVQAYDRKAMYRRVDDTVVASDSSSENSEDDVVEVTHVSPQAGSSVVVSTSNFASTTVPVSSSNALSLNRAGWDSPTPGPSWDTLNSRDLGPPPFSQDRVSVSSESEDPVFRPDQQDSDSDKSKAGSDIVFLKYDKPWNERSPIHLSSDSDGDEGKGTKKKKKSKHKKRRKITDHENRFMRKGKGHKTKNKDKSKSKQNPTTDEDGEQILLSESHKRHHSTSSSDRHRSKKRKKSKDKRDRTTGHNSDRELVDRLFAEAFAQPGANVGLDSADKEGLSSSRQKDREKASRSSDREKSKKKKKSKNKSKDSRSPSQTHAYKKHHSGHKKSSDPSRKTHISEPNNIEVTGGPSDQMSPQGSFDREASSSNPAASLGHSLSNPFQPSSYLPRPDSVQHFPVKLWLTAWPSLPATSYSLRDSSPLPPPASLPHTSSASNLPSMNMGSNHNLAGPSNPGHDSHTISSDSSSDSDTEDTQDLDIPLQNSEPDSRTKQWLETNFPDLSRQPPSSTMASVTVPGISSNSSSWTVDRVETSCVDLSKASSRVTGTMIREEVSVDVVSIPSDDDDDEVVVCSSSSSSVKSDSDVHVVDMEEIVFDKTSAQDRQTTSTSKIDTEGTADLHDQPSTSKDVEIPVSDASEQYLPSTSTQSIFFKPPVRPFQPFKIQEENTLSKQSSDPFIPSMSHSSDDESDFWLPTKSKNTSSSKSASGSVSTAETNCQSKGSESLDQNKAQTKTLSSEEQAQTSQTRSPVLRFGEDNGGKDNAFPDLWLPEKSSDGSDFLFCPPTSGPSSSSNVPLLPILPPLAPTNSSTPLDHIPPPSISVSSSLPHLLPQHLPFVLPSSSSPPSPPAPQQILPLHFSLGTLPTILPPPVPLLPPLFPSYSQSASDVVPTNSEASEKNKTTETSATVTKSNGPGSESDDPKATEQCENEESCVAQFDDNNSTSSIPSSAEASDGNSMCLTNQIVFPDGKNVGLPSSFDGETVDQAASVPTTDTQNTRCASLTVEHLIKDAVLNDTFVSESQSRVLNALSDDYPFESNAASYNKSEHFNLLENKVLGRSSKSKLCGSDPVDLNISDKNKDTTCAPFSSANLANPLDILSMVSTQCEKSTTPGVSNDIGLVSSLEVTNPLKQDDTLNRPVELTSIESETEKNKQVGVPGVLLRDAFESSDSESG